MDSSVQNYSKCTAVDLTCYLISRKCIIYWMMPENQLGRQKSNLNVNNRILQYHCDLLITWVENRDERYFKHQYFWTFFAIIFNSFDIEHLSIFEQKYRISDMGCVLFYAYSTCKHYHLFLFNITAPRPLLIMYISAC